MTTTSRPRATGASTSTGSSGLARTDGHLETSGSGPTFRRVAAVTRISLGFIFLWAFLDKTFALGFDTGKNADTSVVNRFGDAAWIHGASPTNGFLSHATGPFASTYHSLAGHAWVDWLFMLVLLAVGLCLVLGFALRAAAVAGGLMLVLMWGAALPTANNPFMDDHLVYALVLVVLAAAGAGRTWGVGKAYEDLGVVRRHPVLR